MPKCLPVQTNHVPVEPYNVIVQSYNVPARGCGLPLTRNRFELVDRGDGEGVCVRDSKPTICCVDRDLNGSVKKAYAAVGLVGSDIGP